jgi:hypothetical protein
MGKTAYEVRSDLLSLAYTICTTNRSKVNDPGNPDVKEIIEVAERLNEFVSTSPDISQKK